MDRTARQGEVESVGTPNSVRGWYQHLACRSRDWSLRPDFGHWLLQHAGPIMAEGQFHQAEHLEALTDR